MTTPLRSLSGLLDFESAARWSSFKLAAKELHKTPAAVSQQIKGLEQQLGFELFQRHPRNVTLTEKGESLAATLRRNLAQLNQKVEALRVGEEEDVLRISVPHSLSMKWLVPRLAKFSGLYPEVDVRIDNTDRNVDLNTEPYDLALRVTSRTPAANAILLGQENMIAVYSPALEEVPGETLTVDALQRQPLLYQDSPELWLQWLQENRALQGEHNFARGFSHSGVLVQAAVAGQGIALVPYLIAVEDLNQGNLKELAGKPLYSSCRYLALPSAQSVMGGNLRLFVDWLREEFSAVEQQRVAVAST
jgi:LysR family glycine cleavage system transcriptional activator